MTITPNLKPDTGMAVVAIIDPADLRTLEQLRAILPAGALHEVRLPADLEALARRPASPRGLPRLTERQATILPLLMTNLSNKEIGRRLGISHFTVRNHVSQILRALGVPSRRAASGLLLSLADQDAWRG